MKGTTRPGTGPHGRTRATYGLLHERGQPGTRLVQTEVEAAFRQLHRSASKVIN